MSQQQHKTSNYITYSQVLYAFNGPVPFQADWAFGVDLRLRKCMMILATSPSKTSLEHIYAKPERLILHKTSSIKVLPIVDYSCLSYRQCVCSRPSVELQRR